MNKKNTHIWFVFIVGLFKSITHLLKTALDSALRVNVPPLFSSNNFTIFFPV